MSVEGFVSHGLNGQLCLMVADQESCLPDVRRGCFNVLALHDSFSCPDALYGFAIKGT